MLAILGEEHLPRMMQCGHSFCTLCLHSWWGANARAPPGGGGGGGGAGRLLRCPHCNLEQIMSGVIIN